MLANQYCVRLRLTAYQGRSDYETSLGMLVQENEYISSPNSLCCTYKQQGRKPRITSEPIAAI